MLDFPVKSLETGNRKTETVLGQTASTASRRSPTLAGLIAWLLARKSRIAPIPGTMKLHRLEANLGAAEIVFNPRELEEIDSAFARIEIHGDRYTAPAAGRVQR